MKIKAKILGILLVNRLETHNKWWHRLFGVVLGGSSIIVLIFALSLVINDSKLNWVTYDPTAFSLEQNYQQAVGKEFSCKHDLDFYSYPIKTIIKCDGVELSSSDAKHYGELYDSADKDLRMQYGLDKYSDSCGTANQQSPLSQEQISCIRTSISNEQADSSYSRYENDLQKLPLKLKVARNIHMGFIWGDIASWVIIPILSVLVWVIFWNSIIYRSILYVIFGNKK